MCLNSNLERIVSENLSSAEWADDNKSKKTIRISTYSVRQRKLNSKSINK